MVQNVSLRRAAVCFLILALVAVTARAADDPKDKKDPLVVTMDAFRVEKDAAGKEKLVKTEKVEPSQIIEYVLTCRNVSQGVLTKVALLGPIPENTVYLAKSATQAKALVPVFSIDKGKTFQPEPVKYKVKLPDGKEVEKVATPDMYTHVRWVVGSIKAGESQKLRYRVSVK